MLAYFVFPITFTGTRRVKCGMALWPITGYEGDREEAPKAQALGDI